MSGVGLRLGWFISGGCLVIASAASRRPVAVSVAGWWPVGASLQVLLGCSCFLAAGLDYVLSS